MSKLLVIATMTAAPAFVFAQETLATQDTARVEVASALDSLPTDSIRIKATQPTRASSPSADSIRIKNAWSIALDSLPADSIHIKATQPTALQLAITQAEQDSLARAKVKADSITARKSFFPTGIRLGLDVVPLIRIPIPGGFAGWEINADIDFNRFFLVGEFGHWERTLSSSTQRYANGGYYFRIGVDVAFFAKHRDRSMFFAGLRYGQSSFNERLVYKLDDASFGSITRTVVNPHAMAHWAQATTGFRVRVWKGFWMGYTVRLSFAPGITGVSKEMQTHEAPGLGSPYRNVNWGFSYQLFWRFSLKH